MMGSTQENGRTVPFELDGKRKGVKDRLRNIDTAMAWIKGELVSWRLVVGGGEGTSPISQMFRSWRNIRPWG